MAWAPDYLDSDEAKDFLRVDDSVDDTEIGLLCTAVSRAIDLRCGRQFGVVDSVEERFYTAWWDRHRVTPAWVVEIDDLMTTTGLDPQLQDTSGADLGAVTYTLEPRNAAAKGKPWTRLVVSPLSSYTPTGREYECAFTGLWGWSAVPSIVRTAGRLQLSRWLARRDSPYGVAGSPQDGSELRLLNKLDPDVDVMLSAVWRCT